MKITQASEARTSADVRKISEALTQSAFLMMELYCGNSNCAARELLVYVKDYDRVFVQQVENHRGMFCPFCGQRLKMHWVVTAEAHQARLDQGARESVNRQMRKRDSGGDLLFERMSEMVDDRLPPTPDGWFGTAASTPLPRRRFVKGEET